MLALCNVLLFVFTIYLSCLVLASLIKSTAKPSALQIFVTVILWVLLAYSRGWINF